MERPGKFKQDKDEQANSWTSEEIRAGRNTDHPFPPAAGLRSAPPQHWQSQTRWWSASCPRHRSRRCRRCREREPALPGTGSGHERPPDLQGKGKTVNPAAKTARKGGEQHYWPSRRHLTPDSPSLNTLGTKKQPQNSCLVLRLSVFWAPKPAGTPTATARGALLPAPNMASCSSHSSEQKYSTFSCILTLVGSQEICEEGRKGEG